MLPQVDDPVVDQGLQECLAGRKMLVERAYGDFAGARDLRQRGPHAVAAEGRVGGHENPLAVVARVGTPGRGSGHTTSSTR